jgi:hypothetical protein
VGLFPTVIVVATLGELLVVVPTEEDVLVKFDDVVEELLPQDAKTKDGRMRTQMANRYNLPFILSPFVR